ncbi:MAG: class I SAM-dependent methyltransferase [Candidatus Omnitrophica bacterium]|nr:class I SAM-dependent methyltransferase [Candidatus Omnitrophota bacterium]
MFSEKNIADSSSREAKFFNNISSGEYNVLTETDYNNFLEIVKSEIIEKNRLDNLQILEAGCGTGIFGRKILAHLKQKITITGVDISNNLIGYLRLLKPKNYVAIHDNIINQNLFENETFDIIICPFILHHLYKSELEIFVKNSWRWLKSEGYIIAIEPNGSNPILWISHRIGKIYRAVFRNTKYLSPKETVYSCRFYEKLFLKSDFMKIIVLKIQIKGKLSHLGFGIKIFVALRNHLSRFFGRDRLS